MSSSLRDRDLLNSVKIICLGETLFSETPDPKTDRVQDATDSICSDEERAGTGRAAGFRGPAREPVGVRTAKPLISWFLPGNIRMLAGEARDIASDRAGFLGSHPEAGASRAPRKHQ